MTTSEIPEIEVPVVPPGPSASRKDLQIGRRLIHMANGCVIATAYALLFTHRQVVHTFGTIACVIYILDRVRIHYPELLQRVPWVNRVFFRAEEQFKESAMIPYAIAILLTILTFPQEIALIAIYTLAIADPVSAMVGITWGRRHIVPEKSVEGSLGFLVVTFLVTVGVLRVFTLATTGQMVGAGLLIGITATAWEMLPIRIDDNLTIPLVVGFVGWIVCGLLGVPVG
ncbi:MAG TPA: phosphatidate cytidylyltransferase [Candidatus Binatia bacterium]|jgi:dolichol kinase|nr:phosphatidate cytidylyltransferase [Candidatus Binatia bacterium]